MGGIVDTVADLFGVGSASEAERAVDKAASTSSRAYTDALNTLQSEYKNQLGYMKPYTTAGTNALSKISSGAYAVPGEFSFTSKDLYSDPSYAFRLSEGTKATERGAAARTGALSGAAQKALMGYGQNLASTEYQNAYDRAKSTYNTNLERSNTGYNRLSDMTKLGYGAAGKSADYSSSYGSNKANTLIAKGTESANALLQGGSIRSAETGNLWNTVGSLGMSFL